MNYTEAVARIRLYIGARSNVADDLIGAMLNERIKMLCVPFRFPEHEATGEIDTVADTDTIAMPTGVYVIERITDVDYGGELTSVEFQDYVDRDIYATGEPSSYSFHSGTIYILPTPTDARTLRWYGFSLPADISGITEIPMPEDWHPLVTKYVAADILFMNGNHERALTLKNEALGDLSTREEPRTFIRRNQTGQIGVIRPGKSRRR